MRDFGKIKFLMGLSRREIIGRVIFFGMVFLILGLSVVSTLRAVQWVGRPFPGFLVNPRMVVGGVGMYDWTGTEAGLKYPDKVIKGNGISLESPKALKELVAGSPVGEPIVYEIEREGSASEVTIPTMRLSLLDFLIIDGTYLFAAAFFLLLGSIVFLMKPDTPITWISLVVCVIHSLYYLTCFDFIADHTWFSRVNLLANGMIIFTLIHFCMHFPEKLPFVEKNKWTQWLPYGTALCLLPPMVAFYPDPLSLRIYRFLPVFSTIRVVLFFYVVFYWFFQKTSPLARQRAKVALYGASVTFPLLTLFEVVNEGFGESIPNLRILNNFLVYPVLVFPAVIAYSIVKHNLLDVDVYIRRTVGYGIVTAMVALCYGLIQVVLQPLVIAPLFGSVSDRFSPILFAILVVFFFNPLNRKVQLGVDRIFYRKKFDYKETIASVSKTLASVWNLDEIVRQVVHTVRREMFVEKSGLVVMGQKDEAYPAYFIGAHPETNDDLIHDSLLPREDPLLSLVSREKKMITEYDIAEDPHFASLRDSCGKRFAELGATMVIPMIYRDEVKAILAVGRKKSGRFYTREDVELLGTLASQGAVALENAQLADQMKKEEVVRANLSRYLSPQIVDRIVKHDVQVNLGGDRKVVTVLFSDIRNFTTITENRPPDQLVQILNEYFTEMAGVIFENQGSLDKYIGDAVVAVFGSLIPLEGPARNAVSAAVGMMKKVSELNRHWEGRYGFSMNIGIGVATGEVFLGNVGSPERMEFTVIGDAVNVASRFSGLARGGQILVTKPVAEILGDAFRLSPLPPADVKGKTGKMEVFEVLYAQPVS